MFDKLVESSKEERGRRRGGYLVVTTMIYTTALVVSAIATIISFNPVLGKEYFLTEVAPPPPYEAEPEKMMKEKPLINTAPLKNPPPVFSGKFPPTIKRADHQLIESGRYGVRDIFLHDYHESDSAGGGSGEPPPPPPRPKPTITPQPAPEVKPQGAQRVSEGVLQGIAIRRIIPPYPEIAKKTGISGPVQVLVTISEEGRVVEATVLKGHPTLRPAAVNAARQWLFSPTYLGQAPVKVQGVLTFNFVL